ncbi:10435_t:CDS:2 [Cetraspora pellucida]|uniref:10435_t:CDS:1 n=1 Tax=Cetraspora pellucida TaxID=1433469 RepID=A0A9N9CFX4_9GLOM|nr:10435_t:CDS:2 [Cetraspora pellucida]
MNLVYSYIQKLKNKYALVAEKSESVKAWLDFIYESLLEDFDETANKLFALKSNNNKSNIERTQATIEENFNSLSAELWSSHLMPNLLTATKDK